MTEQTWLVPPTNLDLSNLSHHHKTRSGTFVGSRAVPREWQHPLPGWWLSGTSPQPWSSATCVDHPILAWEQLLRLIGRHRQALVGDRNRPLRGKNVRRRPPCLEGAAQWNNHMKQYLQLTPLPSFRDHGSAPALRVRQVIPRRNSLILLLGQEVVVALRTGLAPIVHRHPTREDWG